MKTILVTAKAYFTVPEEAEPILSVYGQPIGITLKGKEYRPIVGLESDDFKNDLLINDADLRRHGMQCIDYHDDTGIEDCTEEDV